MLRDLRCPKLAIVRPWGHKMPQTGVPGPAIGFLQEALRWWDHWLKGKTTGVMAEPQLRAYLQDAVPPQAHYDERPGRWVAEPVWPSPRIEARRLGLGTGRLGDGLPDVRLLVSSPQTTGSSGGEWCPYGMGGLGPEMPLDQRDDDGRSLVFDSDPLTQTLELLGAPVATLTLESDQPVALVVARLNDVAPNGAATRVTFGVLNLTHRASHEAPEPLRSCTTTYTVVLQLNEVGYVIPTGHRLRLAISTAYWPMVWPSPRTVTLAVHTGQSALVLPVRPAATEDAAIRFDPPETAPPTRRTVTRPGESRRTIERDLATGESVYTVARDDGRSTVDAIGVETEYRKVTRYIIREDDPASARMEIEQRYVNAGAGLNCTVETTTAVACSAETLVVTAELHAFDGPQEIFSRSWSEQIKRDLV
jgi:predicted acyl esterase